jgi:putative intracellular protease/amidase
MAGAASRLNGKKGGRPAGRLNNATLTANEAKSIAREELAAFIRPHLKDAALAQLEHAKGVSYMKLRNPDGTFARATDEKQIDAAIAAGATWFRIFTEVPNTQAFVALADRAIDKPTEHQELTGLDGGPLVVMWEK